MSSVIKFAIKDLNKSEYYRQRYSDGWYSEDIGNARFYGSAKQAQKTIDEACHHVILPVLDRSLAVVSVCIQEVES